MFRTIICFIAAIALSMTLFVPSASADPNDPFKPGTMAAQSGIGWLAGTVVIASGMSASRAAAPAPDPTKEQDYPMTARILAAVTLVSYPLVVPAAVNLTGMFMGQDAQVFGSYLGAFIGGVPPIAAAMIFRDNPMVAMAGTILFSVGTVAGSVIGYHIQSYSQQRSQNDTVEMLDPLSTSPGPMLNWQISF